jgi:outer membrane protein TolC
MAGRASGDSTAPPPLAPDATPAELLTYAYASNSGLRQAYWEWVAAIEAIPQEASPATNLALSLESMFEDGETSLERTTLGVSNDPMAGIPWPAKLSAAGRRALETARAAGWRFEEQKNHLRTQVLAAYYDYALLAESARLKQADLSLLVTSLEVATARVGAGAGTTSEVLDALNEREIAASDFAVLTARMAGQAATLNALLGREPLAELLPPSGIPPRRDLPYSDAEILAMVAERNPGLAALARESQANQEAVSLTRMQYIPDLGLSLAGDLGGVAKSVMAMLTVPILRRDAIEASIRQAQAELEASRAARRQAEVTIAAQAVFTLYDLRNAERLAALFEESVIPRLEQTVELTRADYVAGRITLTDVLALQRAVIEARLMLATMQVEREKLLLEIERLAALEPAS